MAERTLADTAREALKLLAQRRLPPTPDNYQAAYEEVAGQLPRQPFPTKALRQIFNALPAQSEVHKRIALHFNQSITNQNWHGIQQAIVAYAHQDQINDFYAVAKPAPDAPPTAQLLDLVPPELAEQLARVLEHTLPMLSEDTDARMHELTDQLVRFLRVAPPALQDLLHMLQNYAYRLSFATEDQAQRQLAIQGLLRNVLTHTSELLRPHTALFELSQQALRALEQPWTLQHLDQLQQQLHTLFVHQMDLQDKTQEAQARIKSLMAESLQRLATLAQSGPVHAQHIEACAGQLEQAQDLAEIAPVLEQLVSTTRAVASDNRLTHAMLQDLQERSEQEQQSIDALQKALNVAETLTHVDPITHTLNAKGLQAGLERELARARRHNTPLSLASVALEGMEALGLERGPIAVEHAQRHLASVMRSVLRPLDLLARDQNSHFYIALAASDAQAAVQALNRLQAELAQRPWVSDDQKIPLGISAGVVQAWGSESQIELMNRADQSLLNAQASGTTGRLALG